MASLLSLIKDGKLEVWDESLKRWTPNPEATSIISSQLLANGAANVRADSVASTLRYGEPYDTSLCIRLAPPYRTMWIEAWVGVKGNQRQAGVLVRRWDKGTFRRVVGSEWDGPEDGMMLELFHFHEVCGGVVCGHRYDLTYLTRDGKPASGGLRTIGDAAKVDPELDKWCTTQVVLALETLQRLNCDNVKLVQESTSRNPSKPRPKGSIVWHTIKVSESKTRTTTLSASGETPTIRRYHWVRGHYADYTKGKGLFGRIKGLFWIPEHDAGSLEAGAVLKDYETA